MKLKLKGGSSLDASRYEETWADGGVQRTVTLAAGVGVEEALAALTEGALSDASVEAAGKAVDLPPLKVASASRMLTDEQDYVTVSLEPAE